MSEEEALASGRRQREALDRGDVRVGPAQGREVYIGGMSEYGPFE
jgi:hypothetical protein